MTLGIFLVLNSIGWIAFILIARLVLRRTVRPKKILAEVESELDTLLTEMNGTTERNIRLLEEAVRRLKDQVAQADKRIRILQGEVEKRTPPMTDYSHLADRKPLSIEVVEEEKKLPVTPPEPPSKTGEEKSDGGDVKQKILELSRQGLDSRLIAGKVGRPLGEVELIISLSEKADR